MILLVIQQYTGITVSSSSIYSNPRNYITAIRNMDILTEAGIFMPTMPEDLPIVSINMFIT